MKTSTMIIGAAIAVAGGFFLYKKFSDKNPWRGTGLGCEKVFDDATPEKQAELLEKLARATEPERKEALACGGMSTEDLKRMGEATAAIAECQKASTVNGQLDNAAMAACMRSKGLGK